MHDVGPVRGMRHVRIAHDLAISETCVNTLARRADIEDGEKPGTTAAADAHGLGQPPSRGTVFGVSSGGAVIHSLQSRSHVSPDHRCGLLRKLMP